MVIEKCMMDFLFFPHVKLTRVGIRCMFHDAYQPRSKYKLRDVNAPQSHLRRAPEATPATTNRYAVAIRYVYVVYATYRWKCNLPLRARIENKLIRVGSCLFWPKLSLNHTIRRQTFLTKLFKLRNNVRTIC